MLSIHNWCYQSTDIPYLYHHWRIKTQVYSSNIQWRIKEFQNWGAQFRRSRILRSGVCFDASSHIPFVFVVRVVNKVHIVNIVCGLKSKWVRVIQSKIYIFSNRARARRAGPRSAFDSRRNQLAASHGWQVMILLTCHDVNISCNLLRRVVARHPHHTTLQTSQK